MKHLNKFNEDSSDKMGYGYGPSETEALRRRMDIQMSNSQNKNLESGKWFFGQDESSHWYMIPFELRDKWQEMTLNDFDDDDYEDIEEFERLFGEYMLGGGIESYVFENPTEIR